MIAQGGQSVYGAALGILMLEARFPRIPGDMGNALTWPFPVHYKIVTGASPDLVVRQGAPGLLDAFVTAGQELVAMGVSDFMVSPSGSVVPRPAEARRRPAPAPLRAASGCPCHVASVV